MPRPTGRRLSTYVHWQAKNRTRRNSSSMTGFPPAMRRSWLAMVAQASRQSRCTLRFALPWACLGWVSRHNAAACYS